MLFEGVAMEFKQNLLTEEMESLERELNELDSGSFDRSSLDPVTIDRVDKRKEWVKDRLEAIKLAMHPEAVA